jgi:GNAT superfamily N-acetyltransferase
VILVRPAVFDDIAELQDVEVDAGQMFRQIDLGTIADDDPPDASVLAEHIRGQTAWTGELGSVVVGYALASVVDGEGHLDQVSVRSVAAGRGIGRLLIDEVCRWAARQGYEALTLTTFRDVPWNGPYYERLGFRELPADRCGAQLRAIRHREHLAGIDVAPRIAMRLLLEHWVGSGPSSSTQ